MFSLNKNIIFISYDPATWEPSLAKYDGSNTTHHFYPGGYNNTRVHNGYLYFVGKLDASDPDLTLFAWDGVSTTPTAIHTPMDNQAPIFPLANGEIAFIATNNHNEPTYFGRPGTFVSVAMPAGYLIPPTSPVVLGNSLIAIAQDGSDYHLVKIEAGSPMTTVWTTQYWPSDLYSSGGNVYFTTNNSGTVRLFKYNGTTVTDLNETGTSTQLLTAAQNGAYVILDRGSGKDLYFYDGTAFTKLTNFNGTGFPTNLTCGRCSTGDHTIMRDTATSTYYLVTPSSFQELTAMDSCLTSGGLMGFYEIASRIYLTSMTCTAQRMGPATFTKVRDNLGSIVPAYISP